MKVFGIGLPRSAGQSLQLALHQLGYVPCVHSPGSNLDAIARHPAAVEVFLPLEFLEDLHPGSLYVVNHRDVDSWMRSCARVYHQSGRWNHPLWKYPFAAFEHYYWGYYHELRKTCESQHPDFGRRVLWHDFTSRPEWGPLCRFLDKSIPNEPFPNRDPVGRPSPRLPKGLL